MTSDPGRLFTLPAPRRRPAGRARRACDVTVRALRAGGRLEAVDEALVVAQRIAADNVDAAERAREGGDATAWVVAGTIRTLLVATTALYARCGVIEADDDDELWAELSAPLGDGPAA